MSKGVCRQGVVSFVRHSYVSTLRPVVVCPCLCTSEASRRCRRSPRRPRTTSSAIRKWTNGVSTTGVTANLRFFDRGILWVLPLTYFYLPKSARAYLFPQSVNNHYFCSGPIIVYISLSLYIYIYMYVYIYIYIYIYI